MDTATTPTTLDATDTPELCRLAVPRLLEPLLGHEELHFLLLQIAPFGADYRLTVNLDEFVLTVEIVESSASMDGDGVSLGEVLGMDFNASVYEYLEGFGPGKGLECDLVEVRIAPGICRNLARQFRLERTFSFTTFTPRAQAFLDRIAADVANSALSNTPFVLCGEFLIPLMAKDHKGGIRSVTTIAT